MRYVAMSTVVLLAVLITPSLGARDAQASFHCMRIHAVMAGANGDANVQYVELRMPTGLQTLVSGTQLLFFDATGSQTGSFTLPGNVSNGATGSSILMGTSDFTLNATVTPDFTMPVGVIAPAGKVQFVGNNNCSGAFGPGTIIDSVAYGGGGYSGVTDFGSVNGASLPTAGTQAITLNNLNLNPSDNSTEYALQTAAPRNNAGVVGTIGPPPDGDGDGLPDAVDPCPANPDCDGDFVSDGPNDPDGGGLIVAGPDNCVQVPNGPGEAAVPGVGNQTNTDADLNGLGATVGGLPLPSDPDGDACDDDIDGDSSNGVSVLNQTPGAAATACPGGSVPVWADCVEVYLGTTLGDNCIGLPGAGGDAFPPDLNGNGVVSSGDVFAIFPFWLLTAARYDLDASGTVSAGDVFAVFPWWLIACT